jgi:7-carboxy-7-deazaguanine synthase (Cx14CxxC type)
MAYRVKELFATLQGEGARSGRAAVFCRFSGCNLWTGREAQRAEAVCRFCDTDFVGTDGPGGGVFGDAGALADAVARTWLAGLGGDEADRERRDTGRYVVCTGGEPLLQLDPPLIEALHARGFEVAIETNGTKPVPPGVDWVCVSPKAGADLVVDRADELKVVVPQPGLDLDDLATLDVTHRFVQPMAPIGGHTATAEPATAEPATAEDEAVAWAVAWCRTHPEWRLSLQTHKLVGIP